MMKISEKNTWFFEKAGLMLLASPEIIFLLLVCGFGGAAVGFFLIGIGAMFALIPLFGLAVYWLSTRKTKVSEG